MKFLLKSSVSAIALATFFTSANAADLGRSTKDTPVVASEPAGGRAIDWTGLYVGGAAGYAIVNHEISAKGFDFDGLSSDGFRGCGILGVKRQFGTFVVGAEGRGCLQDVSTDLTIGSKSASLELDQSYAVYGELGYASGSWLLSALGGYKWQHVKLGKDDDTIGGLSGGLTAQLALDGGRWVIGPEVFVTKFEDQDLGKGAKLEPLELDAGFRVTYHFGFGN